MVKEKVNFGGHFKMVCRDKNGKKKWETGFFHNLVPTAALQYLLDASILGGAQISSWYLGLAGATPVPAAGDTLASHSGWSEFTGYSQAARQAWGSSRSNLTISNGTVVSFSINATGTVGGAFIASVATGTSGTLLAAGASDQGNKGVDSGDTIDLTYSFAAADDAA